MANPAEYHLKLLIGDLAARLAIVLAENERLAEENAVLKAEAEKSKT